MLKVSNQAGFLHSVPKSLTFVLSRFTEQRRRMASQAVEHVSHPLYRRDLDSTTSEEELASKPVGELLLRPSSKIGDLVAVLKTADETYWHARGF